MSSYLFLNCIIIIIFSREGRNGDNRFNRLKSQFKYHILIKATPCSLPMTESSLLVHSILSLPRTMNILRLFPSGKLSSKLAIVSWLLAEKCGSETKVFITADQTAWTSCLHLFPLRGQCGKAQVDATQAVGFCQSQN